MKKRKTKKRRLLWYGAVTLLVMLLSGLGLTIYARSLSNQIETRFSTRRWRVPSRVYSDTTLIYPGQKVNRDLFDNLLKDLGYHDVTGTPARKGEIRRRPHRVDLFLNDLRTPLQKRSGFPVRLRFRHDTITDIQRLDTQTSMPILELEPQEIMLFFTSEREQRDLVSIDQVPDHLRFAVLAAEDNRFYLHHGVDLEGIFRALYTNLRHGAFLQGGSTITQQLAKNFFLTPQKTLRRKFKELIMSIIIELRYEKNEILEIYLNEIYLGQKGSVAIHGVGAASRFYFGKPVGELSLGEAATMAGLIKAPNLYSPYLEKERCRQRRNAVLDLMYRSGTISRQTLSAELPLPVVSIGYTAYGRKAPYFIDYLSRQLSELYPGDALSSLGLSIFTTLDNQVQEAAEAALTKGLERLEKTNPKRFRQKSEEKLQGAVVVVQPKTGAILAMVGGRNYGSSQFNRITHARRQPGSTFKPFVYLSALDRFTAVSWLANVRKTYRIDGREWRPKNFAPVPESRLLLKDALAKSVNLATLDLAAKIGLDRIITTARAFQFSTPIKPFPSLSLGAFEVIPLELACAYSVFAADGVQPYPLSLKEVVDENGRILDQRHMTINRVISPGEAFIMTSMLKGVIEEGTARGLKYRGIRFPVAGKTGTTSNYRDAWFVGYTPDILALIWVGFDNGDPIHATGAEAAMPIWADIIQAVPHHIAGTDFRVPPGVVRETVCSQSGLVAQSPGCPRRLDVFFLAENRPLAACPLHRQAAPEP